MRMNAILDTQSALYIYIYISLLNNFYYYINNDFINNQEKFYLEMNWYKNSTQNRTFYFYYLYYR